MGLVCLLFAACDGSPVKHMAAKDLGGCVGVLGCACDSMGKCSDGSFCDNSRTCKKPMDGCAPGSLECGCAGGGCDSGLKCVDDVCRDNSGFAGGPCLMDNHCHTGNRCAQGVCVECGPGQQGCTCSDTGCNETLDCTDGMCVASTGYAATQKAATSDSCVTACSGPMVAPNGTFIPCPSDGVMNGCLPGLTCEKGQCVCPGSSPKICTSDNDCGDYNSCLSGTCRANCDTTSDCRAGAVCVRRVCRKACDISKSECPDGLICHPQDGQTGACLMRADGVADPTAQAATLNVSRPSMRFSPSLTSGQVTITNTSTFDTTVIVRKARQRQPDPITQQPTTLQLPARELAPDVPKDSCATGTRGCRCGSDSARPCVTLPESGTDVSPAPASTFALACDSGICQLPTCDAGTTGCFCNGTDCRLVCQAGRCPLAFLNLSVDIAGKKAIDNSTDQIVRFSVPAAGTATLTVGSVGGKSQDNAWDGALEIEPVGQGAARQELLISYNKTPDGRWVGDMHYFGNFLVDEDKLAVWEAARDGTTNDSQYDGVVHDMRNAFLEKWADFRRGRIDFKGLSAALTAARTESWRWPTMTQACPTASDWICYPDDNPSGYSVFTYTQSHSPMPSGVVDMPFAMTIAGTGDARSFSGAVDSTVAMQYPGAPGLALRFSIDPAACTPGSDGNCISFVDKLSMTSIVGGRYDLAPGGACTPRYRPVQVPWLVPGFAGRSHLDANNQSWISECREQAAPFSGGDDTTRLLNGDLAAANPILDGVERQRTVELIDGALINGDTMLLLFRERTPPLVAASQSAVSAYGFMTLKRQGDPTSTVRPAQPVLAAPPDKVAPVGACASARPLLDHIATAAKTTLGSTNSTDDYLAGADWHLVTRALLHGTIADDSVVMDASKSWATATEQVHYLCEDTNHFDGYSGVASNDAGSGREPCPADSRVTYFTVNPSKLPSDQVIHNDCQTTTTCRTTFNNWYSQGLIVQQPNWRCAQDSSAQPDGGTQQVTSCNIDLTELRAGKVFYPKSANSVFQPLAVAVDQAFQYRTRFVNRDGKNLGFAPAICGTVQQTLPYCYSPDEIVALEQRFNCLDEIYLDHYDALIDPATGAADTVMQGELTQAIHDALADRTEQLPLQLPIVHPGFEKLRAELLVMLGDDAYTQALASRFDLAGLAVASFQGTQLEPGGINLSGVAGAEMFQLYLATQYYQLALERFGLLLTPLWRILLERNPKTNGELVVGQQTVVEFLGRVIRASSQRARVLAEISTGYQNLDLPDVARHVIERGYIAGYLDSMVLTSFMRAVAQRSDSADAPGVKKAVNDAQLTYRGALADMAEQFRSITDDVNFFGFSRDYIPFPALEGQLAGTTAFEVAMSRAKDRLAIALEAEDVALTTARSFDTDAASFQNALTQVANTYENQLADICGTFTGPDGTVYPAITKYAYLDAKARFFGDPCGRMGTGSLAQALLGIDAERKELDRIKVEMDNTTASANIEQQRIAATCAANAHWENMTVQLKGQQLMASDVIRVYQSEVTVIDRARSYASDMANFVKCSVGTSEDCTQAASAAAGLAVALAPLNAGAAAAEVSEHVAEHELQDFQNQETTVQFNSQCNGGAMAVDADGGIPGDTGNGLLQIDSEARVLTILLQMKELEVEAAREQVHLTQAMSTVQQLVNEASRLSAQMDENFQNTINVEAARNDPNFRIYRNDAVIQADLTFNEALREVYRATRVFEYYTSQSYPDRDKLFLARMISRGDSNLQSYALALEDAFRSFEDDLGRPDLRVLVLSMRDDLLKVPQNTECGEPVSTNDRVKMMQKTLADPKMLDSNGYIVVPFRVGPDVVSPLTRDHKIRYVEAQIIGGAGDQVGRVYVRSAGASMVSTLDDQLLFYGFPQRTGVVDVFFSIKPPEYDPEIFRTVRFEDRPLMNSRWELVLNLKDEQANLDFTLKDINDVRLYFYYTDFTKY
jgi:hypothetical protein